jgi:hypothetical protein
MSNPIPRRIIFSIALAAAPFVVSCAGEVAYSADVATPPVTENVEGVQVVAADYDYPVFYQDNFYWRLDGGAWYRSNSYSGGWARAEAPERLRRVDRPERFAHYHRVVAARHDRH